MKLRTKLMLGTQLLLAAALALCCFLMVQSLRRTLVADAVAYTAAEHRTMETAVRKVLSENGNSEKIDLVQRASLNYQMKKVNVEADASTQYILQTEKDNIFNNCGINAWQVLNTSATEKVQGDRNSGKRYAVVRHEGRDYCVMGATDVFLTEQYLLATVRDITHNMA